MAPQCGCSACLVCAQTCFFATSGFPTGDSQSTERSGQRLASRTRIHPPGLACHATRTPDTSHVERTPKGHEPRGPDWLPALGVTARHSAGLSRSPAFTHRVWDRT